jgi:hypothetical protein
MRRLRASHPGLEFSGVGAGQVLSRLIAHPKATAEANVRRPASIKTRRTMRFTAQLEQGAGCGWEPQKKSGSSPPVGPDPLANSYVGRALPARAPFLILAVVGICVTTAVTVTVAGSALGYAVFLGSGLLAGLGTAWVIARTTSGPLWLFAGAILVTTASLAAPAVVILLIFAVAGAGN